MKQRQNSRVLGSLIGCVLLGLVVSYYLLFGAKGVAVNALNVSVVGKKWLVAITLRYLLGIGVATALIWALQAVSRRAATLATVGHYYLLAWLGGLGILLTYIVTTGGVGHFTVYDQLFFLTRGALTLLAGGVWLLVLQPQLIRWLRKPGLITLLAALLWLPLVFHRDLFWLASGTSITAVIALGIASLAITAGYTPRLRWLWLIPVGIVATPLLGRFEQTIFIMHLSNASRFVGLMSPLTILPAMILVNWLRNWRPWSWVRLAVWLAPVMLACGNYTALSGQLFKLFRRHFAGLGLLWLVVAVLGIMAALLAIAAVACWLAQRLPVWAALQANWSVDALTGWRRLTDWRSWLRRGWQAYGRPLGAFGTLFIVQIGSTLLMNQSFKTVEYMYRPSLNIFGWMFSYQLPRMLAGTLVLLALYWLVLAVTNRYWLSLIGVSAVTVIFAIANRVKLGLRDSPITVADLTELKQLPELVGMVNLGLLIGGGILIVAVMGGIWWLERRSVSARQTGLNRGLKAVVAMLFLASLGQLNHAYSPTHNLLSALSVDAENTNPTRYAQWNGPVLQFVSGFDVQVMAQPAGYSRATMAKVVRRYQALAKDLNQTRTQTTKNTTILFNLSESFADPTRIPGLKFNRDPIPAIHRLMKQTTAGGMMSFGFGGGTADMEYMTLTGMSIGAFDTSLNTPYTQLVPTVAQAPNIGNDFGLATAIHPYTGGFYNRPAVYKKFKFDAFKFLGSKYPIVDQKRLGRSPYLSDETAYANALKQINSRQGGQFINLISIQNHMPYSNWYPNNDITVKNTSGINVPTNSLTTYTKGLSETDTAVKQFKAALDRLNKPVIWVFYGDHLPGIYSGSTNQVLMHTTDYFVYANKYAREHGAKTKLTNTRYVGPDNFIALALAQGNVQVNAYDALLTAVQQQLPAQWLKVGNSRTSSTTGVRFISEAGRSVAYAKLSAKQKQLYHDYQLMLYDLNKGNQYSLKFGLKRVVK